MKNSTKKTMIENLAMYGEYLNYINR